VDTTALSVEEVLAEVERVVEERREFTIGAERRYDEPLGMEFAHPTFDTVRRCNNRCEFCFVAQMPLGLRRSLYVKDDDYRYSFLFGNYVTLTNLDEADWERIGEQHLGPLYVSIHATDLDMRRRVLHNPVAPDVMAQLRRLAALGIEVHAQIVVIPGLDDGPHLDRSIGDLTGLYPALRSVSVVPMGLTRYHQGGCRIHTKAEMRVVLEQVTGWQARLLPQLGIRFAYLSDEWYLRLGEKFPPAEAYDGLDLRENGVGLVLRSLVAGLPAEVVPVVNRFFGETVTVAGLLTGRDVVAQLRERDLGDVVLLPAAMFGGPEGQSLDEMRPQEIGEALGRPVLVGGHPVCRPFTACRA
jgi:putative radical SAM enzyme (TIGR03279 family)